MVHRLAFIAEAPAGEEVDAGRVLGVPPIPLVGQSGRMFAQLLRGAGLSRTDDPPAGWHPEYNAIGLRQHLWERSDHFIGNIWDDRLEDDDFSKLFAGAVEARAGGFGEAEWFAQGYGWLRPARRPAFARLAAELGQFAPSAVVALGPAATWALTGETQIGATQGTRMLAARIVPGLPVYPTLHPAHVVQDYRMRDRVQADIERAAHGVEPWPRNLWLAPDLQDMERWWTEIGSKAGLLAVDIETQKGQIDCVGLACHAGAICVPFVDWRSPSRSFWPTASSELRAWNAVETWLLSPIPKCFQYGLYDVAWLWGKMGIRVRNYRHDTWQMAKIADPEMPAGLAFLGATHTVPSGPWKLMRTGEEKRDA